MEHDHQPVMLFGAVWCPQDATKRHIEALRALKERHQALDIEMSESSTLDIIQIADDVRRENDGLPEYVIRRKVRDAINKSRRQRGCAEHDNIYERNVS
jgi:hypothetical protein